MREIHLNDGSVYAVTMCGASGGYLWITMPDLSDLATAFGIFNDPEKTRFITHDVGNNDHQVYEGYTELTMVENNNGITVVLKKVGES